MFICRRKKKKQCQNLLRACGNLKKKKAFIKYVNYGCIFTFIISLALKTNIKFGVILHLLPFFQTYLSLIFSMQRKSVVLASAEPSGWAPGQTPWQDTHSHEAPVSYWSRAADLEISRISIQSPVTITLPPGQVYSWFSFQSLKKVKTSVFLFPFSSSTM